MQQQDDNDADDDTHTYVARDRRERVPVALRDIEAHHDDVRVGRNLWRDHGCESARAGRGRRGERGKALRPQAASRIDLPVSQTCTVTVGMLPKWVASSSVCGSVYAARSFSVTVVLPDALPPTHVLGGRVSRRCMATWPGRRPAYRTGRRRRGRGTGTAPSTSSRCRAAPSSLQPDLDPRWRVQGLPIAHSVEIHSWRCTRFGRPLHQGVLAVFVDTPAGCSFRHRRRRTARQPSVPAGDESLLKGTRQAEGRGVG